MAQMEKNPPAVWETWVRSLGWEDSPGGWRGNPLQYFCLENPHGHRSLAGYSPQGCKESDTTKRLSINRKAGTQKGFVPGAPQGPALFQPLHM